MLKRTLVVLGVVLASALLPNTLRAEDADEHFEALLSKYKAMRSYVGTVDIEGYSSINGRMKDHYFVAFERPNKLVLQLSIDRATSTTVCDGSSCYTTSSGFPQQYLKDEGINTPELWDDLLRSRVFAPMRLLALLRGADYHDTSWSKQIGKVSFTRGVSSESLMLSINKPEGPRQMALYSNEIYHLSREKLLLRVEEDSLFEGDQWKGVEEYAHIEVDPQLPPSLFEWRPEPRAVRVEKFVFTKK